MTFSDEYLEHWGEEFTRRGLYARGIRFDTFVQDPHAIIAAVESLPVDSRPLLPRQTEVMHRQVQRDLYVEPLRHHSFAVSRHNNLNRRPA